MAERTMTKEVRDDMLGLMPFSKDAKDTFTPPSCMNLPEDLRPEVTVKPFGETAMRKIRGLRGKKSTATGEEDANEAARRVTMGWSNMFDIGNAKPSADGAMCTVEEIEFASEEEGFATKEAFKQLTDTVIADILNHAAMISGIVDKEKLGLSS